MQKFNLIKYRLILVREKKKNNNNNNKYMNTYKKSSQDE